MIKKKIFNKKTYLVFALIFCCILANLFSCVNIAFAEETVYSDVLADLQKDENFDIEDYPVNSNDYTLKVIQIAESVDGEVFVYVYQPSGDNLDLRATSINISTTPGDLSFINYKLKYLNNSGVFYKYLVENYQVPISNSRYYEITSIFREWNIDYDDELDKTNENIINEVSFKVGKAYTFLGVGDDVTIIVDDIDTINVVSKYVGFVRYSGNSTWVNKYCDRHFVAFSTDREIDDLLEADVYYCSQSVHLQYLDNSSMNANKPYIKEFGEIEENYSHLSISDNKVSVTVGTSGLIGNKHEFSYEWEGIQTVDEFIDSVNVEKVYSSGIFNVHVVSNMTEEGLEDLNEMQWVLSFDATDYLYDVLVTGGGGKIDYTTVSDVSILRLQFVSNDKIYNLGVIDNKQTGNGIQDNSTEVHLKLVDWFLIGLACLLALPLIIAFLPQILSFVWFVIKCIAKAIWWLITAPFSIFR